MEDKQYIGLKQKKKKKGYTQGEMFANWEQYPSQQRREKKNNTFWHLFFPLLLSCDISSNNGCRAFVPFN